MLLCWNPGRESPIHNHPCNGCWLKVLQGSIKETRYVENDDVSGDGNGPLRCISDHDHEVGQIAFIEDSMGYHKVGNPSNVEPAVTLHLYCPPFDRCKVWMGADARPFSSCVMTYHSAFGIKIGSDESMYI
jgi:cysteine dioxygenase